MLKAHVTKIKWLHLYMAYNNLCLIHMTLFSIMENAKLLGEKLQDANKIIPKVQRNFALINMEFRTMDKDINTVRPLLMKLQREKDQHTR